MGCAASTTSLSGPQGVRVGLFGSGRTAGEVVKALRSTRHALVRAVVHSPSRAGADLGELTIGEPIGLTTTADLESVVRSGDIDVLLYAGLGGEEHEVAMALCADAGVDLVHACFVHPGATLARAVFASVDARARATGARIVGTGMIPGLWLDVLPSLLVSGLPAPVSVAGSRVSDISSWGADVLVQELGVGTDRAGTATEPDRALRESARMIAEALGLPDVSLESLGGLVSASADTRVGEVAVRRGEVVGFEQSVVIAQGGVERIRLAWSGMPGGGGPAEDRAVEIVLTGGDGSQIVVRVATPPDPYPGTAARMVHAVTGLQPLAGGLHPTTALRLGADPQSMASVTTS